RLRVNVFFVFRFAKPDSRVGAIAERLRDEPAVERILSALLPAPFARFRLEREKQLFCFREAPALEVGLRAPEAAAARDEEDQEKSPEARRLHDVRECVSARRT